MADRRNFPATVVVAGAATVVMLAAFLKNNISWGRHADAIEYQNASMDTATANKSSKGGLGNASEGRLSDAELDGLDCADGDGSTSRSFLANQKRQSTTVSEDEEMRLMAERRQDQQELFEARGAALEALELHRFYTSFSSIYYQQLSSLRVHSIPTPFTTGRPTGTNANGSGKGAVSAGNNSNTAADFAKSVAFSVGAFFGKVASAKTELNKVSHNASDTELSHLHAPSGSPTGNPRTPRATAASGSSPGTLSLTHSSTHEKDISPTDITDNTTTNEQTLYLATPTTAVMASRASGFQHRGTPLPCKGLNHQNRKCFCGARRLNRDSSSVFSSDNTLQRGQKSMDREREDEKRALFSCCRCCVFFAIPPSQPLLTTNGCDLSGGCGEQLDSVNSERIDIDAPLDSIWYDNYLGLSVPFVSSHMKLVHEERNGHSGVVMLRFIIPRETAHALGGGAAELDAPFSLSPSYAPPAPIIGEWYARKATRDERELSLWRNSPTTATTTGHRGANDNNGHCNSKPKESVVTTGAEGFVSNLSLARLLPNGFGGGGARLSNAASAQASQKGSRAVTPSRQRHLCAVSPSASNNSTSLVDDEYSHNLNVKGCNRFDALRARRVPSHSGFDQDDKNRGGGDGEGSVPSTRCSSAAAGGHSGARQHYRTRTRSTSGCSSAALNPYATSSDLSLSPLCALRGADGQPFVYDPSIPLYSSAVTVEVAITLPAARSSGSRCPRAAAEVPPLPTTDRNPQENRAGSNNAGNSDGLVEDFSSPSPCPITILAEDVNQLSDFLVTSMLRPSTVSCREQRDTVSTYAAVTRMDLIPLAGEEENGGHDTSRLVLGTGRGNGELQAQNHAWFSSRGGGRPENDKKDLVSRSSDIEVVACEEIFAKGLPIDESVYMPVLEHCYIAEKLRPLNNTMDAYDNGNNNFLSFSNHVLSRGGKDLRSDDGFGGGVSCSSHGQNHPSSSGPKPSKGPAGDKVSPRSASCEKSTSHSFPDPTSRQDSGIGYYSERGGGSGGNNGSHMPHVYSSAALTEEDPDHEGGVGVTKQVRYVTSLFRNGNGLEVVVSVDAPGPKMVSLPPWLLKLVRGIDFNANGRFPNASSIPIPMTKVTTVITSTTTTTATTPPSASSTSGTNTVSTNTSSNCTRHSAKLTAASSRSGDREIASNSSFVVDVTAASGHDATFMTAKSFLSNTSGSFRNEVSRNNNDSADDRSRLSVPQSHSVVGGGEGAAELLATYNEKTTTLRGVHFPLPSSTQAAGEGSGQLGSQQHEQNQQAITSQVQGQVVEEEQQRDHTATASSLSSALILTTTKTAVNRTRHVASLTLPCLLTGKRSENGVSDASDELATALTHDESKGPSVTEKRKNTKITAAATGKCVTADQRSEDASHLEQLYDFLPSVCDPTNIPLALTPSASYLLCSEPIYGFAFSLPIAFERVVEPKIMKSCTTTSSASCSFQPTDPPPPPSSLLSSSMAILTRAEASLLLLRGKKKKSRLSKLGDGGGTDDGGATATSANTKGSPSRVDPPLESSFASHAKSHQSKAHQQKAVSASHSRRGLGGGAGTTITAGHGFVSSSSASATAAIIDVVGEEAFEEWCSPENAASYFFFEGLTQLGGAPIEGMSTEAELRECDGVKNSTAPETFKSISTGINNNKATNLKKAPTSTAVGSSAAPILGTTSTLLAIGGRFKSVPLTNSAPPSQVRKGGSSGVSDATPSCKEGAEDPFVASVLSDCEAIASRTLVGCPSSHGHWVSTMSTKDCSVVGLTPSDVNVHVGRNKEQPNEKEEGAGNVFDESILGAALKTAATEENERHTLAREKADAVVSAAATEFAIVTAADGRGVFDTYQQPVGGGVLVVGVGGNANSVPSTTLQSDGHGSIWRYEDVARDSHALDLGSAAVLPYVVAAAASSSSGGRNPSHQRPRQFTALRSKNSIPFLTMKCEFTTVSAGEDSSDKGSQQRRQRYCRHNANEDEKAKKSTQHTALRDATHEGPNNINPLPIPAASSALRPSDLFSKLAEMGKKRDSNLSSSSTAEGSNKTSATKAKASPTEESTSKATESTTSNMAESSGGAAAAATEVTTQTISSHTYAAADFSNTHIDHNRIMLQARYEKYPQDKYGWDEVIPRVLKKTAGRFRLYETAIPYYYHGKKEGEKGFAANATSTGTTSKSSSNETIAMMPFEASPSYPKPRGAPRNDLLHKKTSTAAAAAASQSKPQQQGATSTAATTARRGPFAVPKKKGGDESASSNAREDLSTNSATANPLLSSLLLRSGGKGSSSTHTAPNTDRSASSKSSSRPSADHNAAYAVPVTSIPSEIARALEAAHSTTAMEEVAMRSTAAMKSFPGALCLSLDEAGRALGRAAGHASEEDSGGGGGAFFADILSAQQSQLVSASSSLKGYFGALEVTLRPPKTLVPTPPGATNRICQPLQPQEVKTCPLCGVAPFTPATTANKAHHEMANTHVAIGGTPVTKEDSVYTAGTTANGSDGTGELHHQTANRAAGAVLYSIGGSPAVTAPETAALAPINARIVTSTSSLLASYSQPQSLLNSSNNFVGGSGGAMAAGLPRHAKTTAAPTPSGPLSLTASLSRNASTRQPKLSSTPNSNTLLSDDPLTTNTSKMLHACPHPCHHHRGHENTRDTAAGLGTTQQQFFPDSDSLGGLTTDGCIKGLLCVYIIAIGGEYISVSFLAKKTSTFRMRDLLELAYFVMNTSVKGQHCGQEPSVHYVQLRHGTPHPLALTIPSGARVVEPRLLDPIVCIALSPEHFGHLIAARHAPHFVPTPLSYITLRALPCHPAVLSPKKKERMRALAVFKREIIAFIHALGSTFATLEDDEGQETKAGAEEYEFVGINAEGETNALPTSTTAGRRFKSKSIVVHENPSGSLGGGHIVIVESADLPPRPRARSMGTTGSSGAVMTFYFVFNQFFPRSSDHDGGRAGGGWVSASASAYNDGASNRIDDQSVIEMADSSLYISGENAAGAATHMSEKVYASASARPCLSLAEVFAPTQQLSPSPSTSPPPLPQPLPFGNTATQSSSVAPSVSSAGARGEGSPSLQGEEHHSAAHSNKGNGGAGYSLVGEDSSQISLHFSSSAATDRYASATACQFNPLSADIKDSNCNGRDGVCEDVGNASSLLWSHPLFVAYEKEVFLRKQAADAQHQQQCDTALLNDALGPSSAIGGLGGEKSTLQKARSMHCSPQMVLSPTPQLQSPSPNGKGERGGVEAAVHSDLAKREEPTTTASALLDGLLASTPVSSVGVKPNSSPPHVSSRSKSACMVRTIVAVTCVEGCAYLMQASSSSTSRKEFAKIKKTVLELSQSVLI